jgi:hypothetical protein
MQAPYQGKGLIVEREGRIKQRVNSNPVISLDHHITREGPLEYYSMIRSSHDRWIYKCQIKGKD